MSFFPRARLTRAVLVSALVALAFLAGFLTGQSASRGVAPRQTGTPMVQTWLAVLPFDTWSEDPDDDAFSDGLTREIISMLAHEGVRVAPYAVVEPLKGQVVRQRASGMDLDVAPQTRDQRR